MPQIRYIAGLPYSYGASNLMQMDRDNKKLWDFRGILGGGLV